MIRTVGVGTTMLLFTSRERELEYEDLYLEIVACITYPIWLKVSLRTTLDSSIY
jgi:hypothetical protein